MTIPINGIIIFFGINTKGGFRLDITKIVLNPVRLRIIQFLAIHNTSTVLQISNKISDIPKTTLYRHINILEENKIIKVVSENKIRGATEKVYSINSEIPPDISPQDLSTSFLLDLLSKFTNYFENKENDPVKDMVFLQTATFTLTDEEYTLFLNELSQIFLKYTEFDMCNDRKVRTLSTISLPNK